MHLNFSGKNRAFLCLLALSAFLWWGFKPLPIKSASQISRMQVVEQMGQALTILDPLFKESLLKKGTIPFQYSDVPTNLTVGSRSILALGLMEGFPDHSFHPDDGVRVGELIFWWGRFVRFMDTSLKKPILFVPSDLSSRKNAGAPWLNQDFQTMIRIGAISEKQAQEVDPEKLVSDPEVRDFFQATILYFQQKPREVKETSELQKAMKEPLKPVDEKPTSALLESGPPLENHSAFCRGVVLDALSKKPIAAAQVVIDGKRVETKESGAFQFEGFKKNQLSEVFVTASGYQSLSMKHRVGFKNKNLTVFLKPYRSVLRGKILSSATGKPIPDAKIFIDEKVIIASPGGEFEVKNIKPGYHQVEMSAAGFVETNELIYVEEKPVSRVLKMQPHL